MIYWLALFINILSFGAVGDGATDNTAAISRALAECHRQGGGRVVVPAGVFVTGSVHVPSGVTLWLDSQAVIKGSADLARYQPLRTRADLSRYSTGLGTVNDNDAANPQWALALIHIVDADHAGIAGSGTIDGSNVRNPLGEEGMRGPHAVIIANSRHVRVTGIRITNAANYAILGYELRKASFDHLCIDGGWDGIHLRGTTRTRISHCLLSTGDDGIAGGYWRKMTISHCDINSSCNGIRMIQPSVGLTVEDCHFSGPGRHRHITSGKTSSDAAISLEPGGWGPSPGLTDRVTLRRITCRTVLTPLSMTLAVGCPLGRLTVVGLQGDDITRMALSVKSWGTTRAGRVSLRDVSLSFRGIDNPALPGSFRNLPFDKWPFFPSFGLYFRNVDSVSLRNVRCTTVGRDYRPMMVTDSVGRVTRD